MNFTAMIKKPGAFTPLVMSCAALATVLIHIATTGVAPEGDEGTAAHIFQLLLIAEVPIVAYFTYIWLPSYPRPTLLTLTLQISAVLATFAPVYYYNL